MKFLQVGLGSMGKRRIRNLLFHKIPKGNIFGFDIDKKRCQEVEKLFRIKTFDNFDQAVEEIAPDVYIISTPPNLHSKYFLFAAKAKKHFFVEVTTTDDGYAELDELIDGTFIAAPSCTYRHFEPIKLMKKLIADGKIGKVEVFCHHMGQYLPNWHPWEDYRNFYVAKHETSACREMVPFELSWIQWVIGEKISDARGFSGKVSELDIETDDVYAAALSGSGVLGTLLVDVISREPIRNFRVLGTEGIIEWELTKHEVRLKKPKEKWQIIKAASGKRVSGYKTTTEEMYEDEMEDFLDAVSGKITYPYTFAEDQHNLDLLKRIEEGK